jgi:hypothetical protein
MLGKRQKFPQHNCPLSIITHIRYQRALIAFFTIVLDKHNDI